jgi:hypothetical protein
MGRNIDELLNPRFGGKSHQPTEYGVWQVKGEDPNCDYGGHHHQPSLGYFEGTFLDVCEHALTLSNFFTWGAGGDVVKAGSDIKSATLIGDGAKRQHRNEVIEEILHDPVEFTKNRIGGDFTDDDIVEIKFCELVKMLKDYESERST